MYDLIFNYNMEYYIFERVFGFYDFLQLKALFPWTDLNLSLKLLAYENLSPRNKSFISLKP